MKHCSPHMMCALAALLQHVQLHCHASILYPCTTLLVLKRLCRCGLTVMSAFLQAQSPRMLEPRTEEAAPELEHAPRKQAQKRAHIERAERSAKKASLKPLDTDDALQEAASPGEEQALSAGAVKPETPAKVSTALLTTSMHQPGFGSASLNLLDTDNPLQEAASPGKVQALSAGAVEPKTPANVSVAHS